MKKIKIFLASSEDLKTETLELSDLVEHLNLILEKQDFQLELYDWSSNNAAKKVELERALDECELCMIIFGKEFGNFTETDLLLTYNRVCQEGINPTKLYVSFKNIEEIKEDLKKFRDSFPVKYGHFTGNFNDANALKNDFLLQFQLYQSQHLQNRFPAKLEDSKIKVWGQDMSIDFSSLPFVNNVKKLNEIKSSINTLDFLLNKLPKDHSRYTLKLEEKRKLNEEKEKMETAIWSIAIQISGFKEHKISTRLKRAIELFERGEIYRVLEILDSEEINKEAKANIEKIQEGRKKRSEGLGKIVDGSEKIEEGFEGLKNNLES